MENKEMKKPIPVELDDDALDNVSGGTFRCLLRIKKQRNKNKEEHTMENFKPKNKKLPLEIADDTLEPVSGGTNDVAKALAIINTGLTRDSCRGRKAL